MKIKFYLDKFISNWDFTTDGSLSAEFNVNEVGNAVHSDMEKVLITCSSATTKELFVWEHATDVSPAYSYLNALMITYSITSSYIELDYDETSLSSSQISKLFLMDIIKFDLDEKNNVLILYNLNCERDVVDKDLSFVGMISGYFRNQINLMNPIITIQGYPNIRFNYVYSTALQRFYYVESVEYSTKHMTTLSLHEDVLMSYRNLIRLQTAFILRQENDYNLDLVDDNISAEKEVDYDVIDVTNTDNNLLRKSDTDGTDLSIVIETFSK